MSSGRGPSQGHRSNSSGSNSGGVISNVVAGSPSAVVRRGSSGCNSSSQSPSVAAAEAAASSAAAGATRTTTKAQATSSSGAGLEDPATATLARMTAADLSEDSQVAVQHHDHRLPSSSRVMRNMAEKMRRDKLNNYITELATIVPLVSGANKRIDKTSVLRLAANYIRLNRILKGEDDEDEKPSIGNVFDAHTSQQFMDVADGFLLLVTSTGKVVYVTDAIETNFGHSKVDLLGNNIYSIIHPDDIDIFQQQLTPKGSSRRSFYCRMMEKALSRNDPGRYEIIHVVGKLTPIPQSFRSLLPTGNSPLKDEPESPDIEKGDDDTDSLDDGSEASLQMTNREGTHILKAFIRVVKDRPITELSLMESIQDEYITRHRMDGSILYTDHRISFVTGLMPGEVLGNSAFSYMHTDDMLWSIVAQKHMFSSSQGQGVISYRLQCRDGTYVTLRSRGFLEVNKQTGKVDTFVCINTVLSICEASNEIKTQRRKLLPMISCQQTESFLSSISSSLPTELYELLKPILNAETVQRMAASVDNDLDTDLNTKSEISSISSTNISEPYDSKDKWPNDGWEEINPNHPPPKPLPSPGKIKELMNCEDTISTNQWYSTNPKKRNQDEKNYYPPNKKLNTLNSHSEPFSSYSQSESHKQNYSIDAQTYCQQNLSYQHDGAQLPSDHPVAPQKKRFCPDNINLRNSFQTKSPNINCSISSPLGTSAYTDDDQSSLCSVQSPSGIQSPLSVESCMSTIFGSPPASMCSNFDGTPDSNMDNNRYPESSGSSMGNNSFSRTSISSTVSSSKSYNGTNNNSNFEMVDLSDSAMNSPECISPSICSGQQQLNINRPSIAQVHSPGRMTYSPTGIVQSSGLSSPTDIHSMSSISPVHFQSHSSLPDQNFNSTHNYSFKKSHDKNTILQTPYQTPRRFHQEMIRNTSTSNSVQADGNSHLSVSRDQEPHDPYNLKNSRLGIQVEQQSYFHHQYTPENKQTVSDNKINTCSAEPHSVVERGEQGNNTLYLNSVSCNAVEPRGPPPPITAHPMQPPEAPRYNPQQQQQQQQQQQHIGQNL